ncbi:MAG: cob(I)yrinic acid a,c-diamide adenosyltransferase [Anaerolineae bacterium]
MKDTLFYTGTGDTGTTTRLQGRKRLSKADALLEALGTLDEATSTLGVARAQALSPPVQRTLLESQRRLYRLMSHLSAVPEARANYPGLTGEDVMWLEQEIAQLEARLPPLEGFVLPGDSPTGAACHLARATVRRAERRVVVLTDREANIGPDNLAFLNRLSSYLFAAALYEDLQAGHTPTAARAPQEH